MVDIRGGIENVISETGKNVDLNLYYDYKSKAVFTSEKYEDREGAIYIALIQTRITETEIHELVNAVIPAVFIDKILTVPADATKYTAVANYQSYEQIGGEIQNYDGFLMACYLWKVYESRHLAKKDGKEVTLYIGADGNSFVRDDTERNEHWHENFEAFPHGVFLAVDLPVQFASQSLNIIGAAVLAYAKVFKNAMEHQRKYLTNEGEFDEA